ncbi:HlyD family secretion protein [Chitinolyticbacter albus]|uniref:HlyD family secretion protein n=1 Tax=Chitinolyticbacter albus TaxID=2961951 RepID=UPI00210AC2C9|nr:HlyD family efflux transporter periplasmic adaptor subunit [Chitinolyticbacter albus]
MRIPILPSLIAVTLLAACSGEAPSGHQGYVEGEYVAVAAGEAGRLSTLNAARGQRVAQGAPLFALEADYETALRAQRAAQLATSEAQWRDLQSGKRPQELAVLRAQLAAAEAEARRAEQQRVRDEAQLRAGGIAEAQLEQSRTGALAAAAELQRLREELTVAQLPGREAQSAALKAQIDAARGALAQADWALGQKAQRAPAAALVADTLYRVGEWVPAGSPVLRLLPPGNVKVRFFVPQAALGRLQPGSSVTLACAACGNGLAARVDYVSPQAEFTPPVIYSNDTRDKLVFMVEARPEPGAAAKLQPGLPVTVSAR